MMMSVLTDGMLSGPEKANQVIIYLFICKYKIIYVMPRAPADFAPFLLGSAF